MSITAVMQPYLFPYLGYYQLVNHSDDFVFYDDVNYIKGGYINRNNILSQGKKQLFTIPVEKASSFKKINELNFSNDVKKVIRTIEQSYSKAPYFEYIMPLVLKVITQENRNVAKICEASIKSVFTYLGVDKNFLTSSQLNYNRNQTAKDKLFSICSLLKSNNYCNSAGGKTLYNKDDFNGVGVELSFIKMDELKYVQPIDGFINHLSIIDVLMNCSKCEVIKLLDKRIIE